VIVRQHSCLISSSFATSQENRPAFYSTFTQRVLSACGTPAAVWATFFHSRTSTFHCFTDPNGENAIIHGWMTLRIHLMSSRIESHLLSEPYLSRTKHNLQFGAFNHYPKLYFYYNRATRQTTVISTDILELHLSLIQHVKDLAATSMQPEEIFARILLHYF